MEQERNFKLKTQDKTIDYSKFIDRLLTYTGLLDPDGIVLMVNRTVLEISGLSYGDVIGRYLPDIWWWSYDPEVQARIRQHIKKAQGGETVISQEKMRTAGGYVDIRFSLRPVFDANGRLVYAVAEGWDITGLHDTKNGVGRSPNLLDSILDIAGIVDGEKKLRHANKVALDTLGFAEEEVIGLSFAECPWFDQSPETKNKIKWSLDAALQGKTIRFESRLFTREGREIPIYYSAAPIRSNTGEITGVAVEGRNISELKQKEAQLAESESLYRDLVTNMNEGVGITDEMGNYTFVNPRLCEMLEYRQEELIGMNFKDALDEENRIIFLKEYNKRPKRKFSQYEITFTTKSGKKLPALIAVSRIMDKGVYKGTRGVLTDLTALKKMESQLLHAQKMESVGVLAGGVAHDFNNILQTILGYTEMLMVEKEPGHPDLAYLKAIESAAQRARDLTRQLLTFSRKTEQRPRPLDINRSVREVCEILKTTIPKMIDIELTLADDPGIINADPAQIEQVLMNLAINAKDAMPNGGRLMVETENVTLDEKYTASHLGAKPGKYVLLTVSDTGQGIDEETLKHIFEPFFTTKEVGKGTGLGLATVYGIVKDHDGYITCYSGKPGLGTTFKVYLPVIDAMAPERNATIRGKKDLPRGTETVLVVDDEKHMRNLGCEMLTRQGFSTISAVNGEQALEIYKEKKDRIDLIILDLNMPGMGGHRCLQELIKMDPQVKVIIASGYSAQATAGDTIQAGAAGFIGKPYRFADLLNKAREVLDKK